MTKLQLSCFILLISFLSFAMPATQRVDWHIQTMRTKENAALLLLNVKTTASFKCDSPLTNSKRFSGIIDIYSVDYHGYKACNATKGKMLGTLKCGQPHYSKAKPLNIVKKDAEETYYFIGFGREKTKPNKPVLLGGTCKSHKSKLMIHFCDPVLTPTGEACTMESCPLSLGVEDGRINDKQLSASSELDKKHSAKHGRLSLKKDHNGAWCSAPTFDVGAQYIQVDLETVHTVSAVSTQGAVTEKSWVSGYLVHYSLNGIDWIVVSDEKSEIKIFMGNKDQSTVVRHWLKPHIHARFVRFLPFSWVGQRCMRVELHGCKNDSVPIKALKANLTKGQAEDKCPPPWTGPSVGEVCNRAGDECKTDDECSDDSKCCHDGCRKVCVAHKQGEAEDKCPSPWTGPSVGEVCSRAGDKCKTDDKCSDDRKCCHDGCRKVCVAHKQGQDKNKCPPPWTGPSVGEVCNRAGDECKTDDECSDDRKCCHDGCRKVCTAHAQERFPVSGSNALCGGESCPPYAQCNHTDNGDKCACPGCSHDGKKVCGSDGKTYKDSCELKKHSCENNQHIKVVSQGECAALPNVAVSGPKSKEKEEKKSSSSFKTFYICTIFVAVLGVVIALAMCIFQPHKSQQIGDRRNQVSNCQKETAFRRLHDKYHVENMEREDK